jgi:hypothetical protein
MKTTHQWPDGTLKDGSVCKTDKQLLCEIHTMLKQLLERQSENPVSPAGSATPPQVASHGPAGAPPPL